MRKGLLRGALIDILAVALAAAAATAARAREPLACNGGTAGLVACVAGRLCACGFARGGTMTGLRDGYLWDCGINRPPCPDDVVPATIDSYQGPLPESVDLSRSATVIQQQQRNATRQRTTTSIEAPPSKPPMPGGPPDKPTVPSSPSAN